MCHWCQKIGHLIAECRAKAAQKPKTKHGFNAARLEEAWEEDTGMLEAADALDEDVDPLESAIGNESLDD